MVILPFSIAPIPAFGLFIKVFYAKLLKIETLYAIFFGRPKKLWRIAVNKRKKMLLCGIFVIHIVSNLVDKHTMRSQKSYIDEQKGAIAQLRSLVASHKTEEETLNQTILSLHGQVASLESSCDSLQATLIASDRCIAILKDTIKSTDNTIASLERSLAISEQSVATLTSVVTSRDIAIAVLESTVKTTQTTNERLESDIESLKSQVIDLLREVEWWSKM